MPRSKKDGRKNSRSSNKTRNQKAQKGSYKNYNDNDLIYALHLIEKGKSVRAAAKRFGIPLSTLADAWSKFRASGSKDIGIQESKHATILTKEEEDAIERYLLWQQDRGMPLIQSQVKALIRELHCKGVEIGESRRKINLTSGPSYKYMREFYKRHPELSKTSAESVDRGCINMASQDTIKRYYDLLKDVASVKRVEMVFLT